MAAAVQQQQRQRAIISAFALACVAITSAFMLYLSYWLVGLLSGSDWCRVAIGAAEDMNARPLEAIKGCFALLDAQVEALARALLISLGTLALCLVVLIVIVVAGGELSFNAGPKGVAANVGREVIPDRAAGALDAADAAHERAEEILEEESPADAPARPRGRETEIME